MGLRTLFIHRPQAQGYEKPRYSLRRRGRLLGTLYWDKPPALWTFELVSVGLPLLPTVASQKLSLTVGLWMFKFRLPDLSDLRFIFRSITFFSTWCRALFPHSYTRKHELLSTAHLSRWEAISQTCKRVRDSHSDIVLRGRTARLFSLPVLPLCGIAPAFPDSTSPSSLKPFSMDSKWYQPYRGFRRVEWCVWGRQGRYAYSLKWCVGW